jgi:hypothetical protein
LNKNIYKKNQIEKPLKRERELHNEKKVDAIADRVRWWERSKEFRPVSLAAAAAATFYVKIIKRKR